jgi:two-component system, chemotaxis family, CheB/CheR fusion protein
VEEIQANRGPDGRTPPGAGPSRVVGIGASAGGLEALRELLERLTPDGTAYVVAQHLAPGHPSLLVELLSRDTSLRVLEAVDGERLQPGVMVIGAPNHDLTVVGDRLRLVKPAERSGPSPNVDLLFESLARDWAGKSAAIILSGTGSDGAVGMRAVARAGGLTLVQQPESAGFDAMPRAADGQRRSHCRRRQPRCAIGRPDPEVACRR